VKPQVKLIAAIILLGSLNITYAKEGMLNTVNGTGHLISSAINTISKSSKW